MLWHHYAGVNSHQRWKQTQFRVCFHLWCELTITMNVTEWQVSWNSWKSFFGRKTLDFEIFAPPGRFCPPTGKFPSYACATLLIRYVFKLQKQVSDCFLKVFLHEFFGTSERGGMTFSRGGKGSSPPLPLLWQAWLHHCIKSSKIHKKKSKNSCNQINVGRAKH